MASAERLASRLGLGPALMDLAWLAAEGAAILLPAGGLGRAYWRQRQALRRALEAPLFYEAEQGWSLRDLAAEFNGQVDLSGALAESMELPQGLGASGLEGAVKGLQGDAGLRRRFLRNLATDAALAGPGPWASLAPLALVQELDQAWEEGGFRGMWMVANAHRQEAYLPVVGLALGPWRGPSQAGLPPGGGRLTSAFLEAGRKALLGEAPGGWGAVAAELMGAWAEARHEAQAKEAQARALTALGQAAIEAFRAGSPTAQRLRRNVHGLSDRYRQLHLAWAARKEASAWRRWPHLEGVLHPLVAQAFVKAEAQVLAQSQAMEAVLRGRQGPRAAGALLWAHREALTKGLPGDALPFPEGLP